MAKLPDPNWNITDTSFPDNVCIQDLFEEQVAKTPDVVALIDDNKQYTYEQLNNMSNYLAQQLRQRGVYNETVVGCYLERSSVVVMCILAILKAGGTYILLDAKMPALRLEYIISDARPNLILTETKMPMSVKPFIEEVDLWKIMDGSENQDYENVPNLGSSGGAAYISYTSGSTGQPKGVTITHKSTVNHALAFSKMFKLGTDDRVPIMAPIGFDMAIEEMIPPLLSGCSLIVSEANFDSMEQFNLEITANNYSLLNIPAPLWREWVEFLATSNLPIPGSLKTVIVGSESIDTKSFFTWTNLNGSNKVKWFAAYGTTETTITSTIYSSEHNDDLHDESFMPIGKPIANTYAYILNEKQEIVEVGEEGELYIGGIGVARGYLGKKELTDKAFIPNRFRTDFGAKMYKTGDLARFRPDGNIVWLGRIDTQIKLYGLRIEPGEIEAVLNRDPSVDESVVVLQISGDREADKHLVAFVTIQPNKTFEPEKLRQLASDHLQRTMVPEKFIQITSIPLNQNGKIDRRALEKLDLK